MGLGFGTFIKIRNETVLRNNALINIGDSYIVVTFSIDEDYSSDFPINDLKPRNTLNLKVFNSNEKSEQLYYFF